MKAKQPAAWWQEYFSPFYKKLYTGVLAEELSTDEEIAHLLSILPKGSTVLDVGCGYGRHLLPLRRAGHKMVGVDYSLNLLKQIHARSRSRIVCGDMRHLPVQYGRFDAVLMMFNTFGYFDEPNNAIAVGEAFHALKEGGFLLLDIPSYPGMMRATDNLPITIRQDDRTVIEEAWGFDDESRRLIGSGSWQIGAARQPWKVSIRVYTPQEITELLTKIGFSTVACWPAEDLESVRPGAKGRPLKAAAWKDATNMFVVAQR